MKVSTRFYFVCLLVFVMALIVSPIHAQSFIQDSPPAADFWSSFAQNLALQLGPLLAAALVAWVLREAGQLWMRFKGMQPDIAGVILDAARIAVRAAEQSGMNQAGNEKKTYALSVAQNWLNVQGLKVDLSLINAAIEAAVLDEFNRFRGDDADLEATDDGGAA